MLSQYRLQGGWLPRALLIGDSVSLEGTITLLYAMRDDAISDAAVLQQVLTRRLAGQAREK
jgi:hypothetical protein